MMQKRFYLIFSKIMKTFVTQFQGMMKQTKKLMNQLKKKKSKVPEELEKIEKALAKTTNKTSSLESSFSIKDVWSFWLI